MDERQTNPFRGFVDVMSEMHRAREVGLGRSGYDSAYGDRQRTHVSAWVPSADVFARGQDLVIRIELAGVSREDIDITLYDNVLTVSGLRAQDTDEEEVNFYVHERFYGAFRRSMTLPARVDEGSISAYFENGVLEVNVRGGAAAEPRRIDIRDKP